MPTGQLLAQQMLTPGPALVEARRQHFPLLGTEVDGLAAIWVSTEIHREHRGMVLEPTAQRRQRLAWTSPNSRRRTSGRHRSNRGHAKTRQAILHRRSGLLVEGAHSSFQSHGPWPLPPVAHVFGKSHQISNLQLFSIIENDGAGKTSKYLMYNGAKNKDVDILNTIQDRFKTHLKAAIIA